MGEPAMQVGEGWREAHGPVLPLLALIGISAALDSALTSAWISFTDRGQHISEAAAAFGTASVVILDVVLPIAILWLIVRTFPFRRLRHWPADTLAACMGTLVAAFLTSGIVVRDCGGVPIGHLGWWRLPGDVAELLPLLMLPGLPLALLLGRTYDYIRATIGGGRRAAATG